MPRDAGTKPKNLSKPARLAALAIAPSRERLGQSPVEVVAARDPDGWPVMQHRAIDTVGRLIRAGLVDIGCADSVDRFRRDFHRAQFDSLCAADLNRQRGAGGREQIRDIVEDARQRIWEALNHLGGLSAPSGSIVWHVVGQEMTLRDWSTRQVLGAGRSLRQEVATGILVAALGVLHGYYTTRQRRRERMEPCGGRTS